MTEKDLEIAKFTRLCPSLKMSYFREEFVQHINHRTLRVAKSSRDVLCIISDKSRMSKKKN